jgi:hypothetical protein
MSLAFLIMTWSHLESVLDVFIMPGVLRGTVNAALVLAVRETVQCLKSCSAAD